MCALVPAPVPARARIVLALPADTDADADAPIGTTSYTDPRRLAGWLLLAPPPPPPKIENRLFLFVLMDAGVPGRLVSALDVPDPNPPPNPWPPSDGDGGAELQSKPCEWCEDTEPGRLRLGAPRYASAEALFQLYPPMEAGALRKEGWSASGRE
jgi:hypothetical protein